MILASFANVLVWAVWVVAAFACLARDRDTTRELINELGDKLQLGTSGPISNDACKALANGK